MSTQDHYVSSGSGSGKYFGELLVAFLSDGRRVRLAKAFGFCDARGKRWPVPAQAVVDGASIPQVLWPLMGGPFTGKYRDASVVHDYYCSVRLEPWQAVHHVFYEAMRVSGVSEVRAKLMYAAVYFAGPRWSDMDSINTKLSRVDNRGLFFQIDFSRFDEDVFSVVGLPGQPAAALVARDNFGWGESGEIQLNLDQMQRLIADYDPSLSEIERAIDQAVFVFEPPTPGNSRNHVLVTPPAE